MNIQPYDLSDDAAELLIGINDNDALCTHELDSEAHRELAQSFLIEWTSNPWSSLSGRWRTTPRGSEFASELEEDGEDYWNEQDY